MIEKIKHLFSKIPYGLIPMVVVGIYALIGGFITFLIFYKSPISLDDEKDKVAIINLIKEQHPEYQITNVNLCEEVALYPITFDTIYTKSAQIENEDDIFWYTRVVNYDVIIKSDTVNHELIFEVTEKFLREEVGQFLFVVNKENGNITY